MVRGELDILKATVPLLLTATVLLSNSAKSDGLTAQDYAEKGLESATFFRAWPACVISAVNHAICFNPA